MTSAGQGVRSRPHGGRARLAAAAVVLCLALLTGCSTTAMLYDNAPWLLRSQVDDYFDLDPAQEERLDVRLAALFDWHRRAELPAYARALQSLSADAADGLTRAELEGFLANVDAARLRLLQRTLPDAAAFLASVSPAQLAYYDEALREAQAERDAERGATPRERAERRVERYLERFEFWVGDLSEPQRKRLQPMIAALPDLHPQWAAQRTARHEQFLALMATGPDAAAIEARLHHWWSDLARAYPPDFQRQRAAFWDAALDLVVQLDGMLSSVQRRHLLRRLDGYREDFVRLAAASKPRPAAGAGRRRINQSGRGS